MSKSKQGLDFRFDCSLTDRFLTSLASHPYLWTFAFCIVVHVFTLGAEENVPPNALLFETLAVLGGGLYLIYYFFKKNEFPKAAFYFAAVAFTLLTYCCLLNYSQLRSKGIAMLLVGSVIILLLYYFADTKKLRTQLDSLLILSLSFLVKIYYIYYTSCYTRQHDVHSFGQPSGHAGYIEYLLFNRKLSDFDVREVWQYCHPPLHHIISAFWIHLNESIFGVGFNPARESLQTLSLFYTMCIVISAYRLFRMMDLKGAALYVPTVITAFHPAFIMFSGSINNDPLSVAFVMGALLCTVRWYREQKFVDLMKIALCIGFGMMTKLSAALVAPPIALVFLIVFIKRIREQGSAAFRMIGQFAAFGAVCIPLGLWFEIKNYIKFKVPITYVQEMPNTVMQYIGDMSYTKRITDFSKKQFASPFEQWLTVTETGERVGYNEYNPLVALLKNSIFGEYINDTTLGRMPHYLGTSKALLWLAAFIAAVCLVCMIAILFKDCGMTAAEKTLFASFYVMLIANFYKMAYDYPFTCTLNFRYITPTVILGSLFLGTTLKNISESRFRCARAVEVSAYAVAIIFALLAVTIFAFVCFPFEV